MIDNAPDVPHRMRAWQEFSYPLSNFSTLGAGGVGKLVFFPRTVEELKETWVWACKNVSPPVLVGCGSNLLFGDGEIATPIICHRRIKDISFDGETMLAQCGAMMSKVVRAAQSYSLSGLEFSIDIPGTVGGSIMGNAGAYGADVFRRLSEVEYLDVEGKRHCKVPADFNFGYRRSGIPENSCIVGASFILDRDTPEAIEERIREYQRKRRANQPHPAGSAGSIFKNPEGVSAWELIDSCGLKGYRRGQIGVSDTHANWLINYGGATSTQIIELCEYIAEKVLQERGVQLEREIKLYCF